MHSDRHIHLHSIHNSITVQCIQFTDDGDMSFLKSNGYCAAEHPDDRGEADLLQDER